MSATIIKNKANFLMLCEEQNLKFPLSDDVSVLSSPVKIGDKTVKNRLVCQPMEGCDGTDDGRAGELTLRKYERLAKGGAGLICMEATAVQQNALANPRQLFLNKNTLDSFKSTVNHIKETGLKANGFEPLVILQLTHSGRYSKPNGYPEPLIAYNNPLFEKDKLIPSEQILSDDELDKVRDNLVSAARLAEEAGFDGADIKSCHGYLLSELLSAYTRKGRYGGAFENRTRLLLDSVQGATQNCSSDFIITTRLNIYDGFPHPYGFGVNAENGLTPDYTEPVKLAEMLKKSGAKLINITMGNPYVNPYVNRPFVSGGYNPEHPLTGVYRMLSGTRQIQNAVPDIPVICSGISYLGVMSAQTVAACIQEGWFAMAGFGRMTLAYPDYANDIINNNELNPTKCCIACSKCSQIMRNGGTPGCVIRDKEVYLPIYKKYCK